MTSNLVLAATALWHLLAVWHFAFFPVRTLARSTNERPVNLIATELFRFLGALNFGYVVLALLSLTLLPPPLRLTTHLTLAAANASQLLVDLRVRKMSLAKGSMFTQILIGDAVFMIANVWAAMIFA